MKRIKHFFKIENVLLVLFLFIFSCNKDDDSQSVQAPKINHLEVGLGNSHIGYIGSDLHIEVEVVAEGLIETIAVEINRNNGEGQIQHTYSEFSGLRNTDFHKHIDIPRNIEPRTYQFHFVVTDQKGQTTQEEITLSLLNIEDNSAPVITLLSNPEAGQLFNEGQNIEISGIAADNISLSSFLIVLVREEDHIPDWEVNAQHSQVIVVEHTDHFDTVDFHEFNPSITVGAEYDNNIEPQPIEGENAWQSGSYYILVIAEDLVGNKTFSEQLPVELYVK